MKLTTVILLMTTMVVSASTYSMNASDKKSTIVSQQQQSISGTVTDEQGLLLAGVTVVVKGTNNGTITGDDGAFSLSNVPEDATLVFSFIGMKTLEVPVSGQSTFNVTLQTDAIGIEEVVAIGYGTMQKKDLTGAVGQVKGEDLEKTASVGFHQALKGKIAGVQVTNNTGSPGGSISMRIRGVGSINSTNEPLYVIDGVPYGSLNSINVNDIERIDVLKDAASASIYGSRASNGVVLVTTKGGQKGFSVSLDGYTGMQSVVKTIDLLNGEQFAELANENLLNGGLETNPLWSNPSAVRNTDWQSELFKPAPIRNVNIQISNGGDKSSTLFSFGYHDQDGIIVGGNFKRYTVRLNHEYNISEKLKAGIKVNGSFEHTIATQGDIEAALSLDPTRPVTTDIEGLFGLNADGSINTTGDTFYGYDGYVYHTRFANVSHYPQNINNVIGMKEYAFRQYNSKQILSTGFLEYEILKGLKIKSNLSLTFGDGYNDFFRKAAPDALNMMWRLRNISAYQEGWSKGNQRNWINTVAYNNSIGKHNISAVAGIDALDSESQYVNITTQEVPEDSRSIVASDLTTRLVNGLPGRSSLLSYFARASYDYDGKYLVSGTIRRDGSSNFAAENQWGVFKSGSVGWRISQEDFMESISAISDLKLRASYGTVGNQNIPDFMYLSTYTTEGGRYQYTLGPDETPVLGVYQGNVGAPTIHWEQSTQTNIGLDLSLFNQRLSLTADYYIKELSDLLGNFPVPSYTGVPGGSMVRNGFSMENSGIELAVDYRNQIGELNYSVGANFATLENKITKLTDNEAAYVSQSINPNSNAGGAITQTKVGGRIGNFLGYLTDGIAQTDAEAEASALGGISAGDRMYKDINDDGIINSDDRVILGNGLPKYIFGMNLNADYKGFDISVLLTGQAGVEIAYMATSTLYDMRYHNSTGIVNGSADLMNRWTGEGTTNTFSRNAYDSPRSNDWFSDRYIHDGSYVRIGYLQLGYTLNERLLNKVNGISHLRIYISADNLYTFSNYPGYDPEIGSPNQNALQTGADLNRYPLARTLSVGVNCRF